MPTLDVTFAAFIDAHDIDGNLRHKGPLFHRWLPEGEADAITVDYPDAGATIRIWCERRGYVDDSGFIRYDHKRREVDESIIPRQGVMDGGALFGRVIIHDLSADEYDAVVNDKTGTDAYIALGKRVVKKLVDPALARLGRILRDTYGQYWISPPERFDSRERSLGQHCHLLNMKWSTPEGQTGAFLPTERSAETLTIMAERPPYGEYLDRGAWHRISSLMESAYEPPIALTFASRVRRFLDEGRIEHALLEAVTALELAVEAFVRQYLADNETLRKATKSFWQISLPARVGLIGPLAGAHADTVTCALEGISKRNDFVHEGRSPPPGSDENVKAVLDLIRQLNRPDDIRFPYAARGNELRPTPEDWETGP